MFIRVNILLASIVLPNIFCFNGKQSLEYSVRQYSKVASTVKTGIQYPSIGIPSSSTWNTTVGVKNEFRVGFYPGILWHLFNYTSDEKWKHLAIEATDGLFDNQFRTDTHDIGFQIMSSYGEGYRFTKNSSYPPVIVRAAHSLATRFNPKVGCTRSWNSKTKDLFLVIADNMMNLELLFEGWRHSGNKTLYDMAVSHTNRTIEEHIRKDFSHFQVVAFNETDGTVIRKYTSTGYADWSCWSQAQGWLVSGLTTAYRYTHDNHILKYAEGVANYFIDNAPADGIPLWDFNVPTNDSYQPRDSSAASTAATGLIELFGFTKNVKYLNAFSHIMENLFSSKYMANSKQEYKIPALIVNGTYDYKRHNFDTALIFGDYYLIKALKHFL